jgi:DNA mismatch repair ATPase MutS
LIWPFSILTPQSAAIERIYGLLGGKTQRLQQYARLFEKLEKETFQSEMIQQAVQTLTQGNRSAYAAVKKLSAITKVFDFRLNLLTGIFLNIFFLWDILQSIRVERWKKQHSAQLQGWLDALGQVDMLCSLAGFAFQHPEAVFPKPVKQEFIWNGQNLKHPFIPEKECVGNPVNITGEGKFLIITGANMAGKSTYLRTTGINLLLAMTGAPVLAKSLTFTPIQLFTGIKTSDSLQDGESYFFAELKRLKEIIVRLEKGEHLFIILDEILRGTNSKDKQKGSKALLRQLIRLKASGMIATHDLALGELAAEFPQNITNKRFEVEIKNNQLQFDYRLKDGIAENLNATFLMKKMGITL